MGRRYHKNGSGVWLAAAMILGLAWAGPVPSRAFFPTVAQPSARGPSAERPSPCLPGRARLVSPVASPTPGREVALLDGDDDDDVDGAAEAHLPPALSLLPCPASAPHPAMSPTRARPATVARLRC